MLLSSDCCKLLGDIYGKREDKSISLIGKFEDNEFREMLRDLEKRKAIRNLSINFYPHIVIETAKHNEFEIKFEVLSWKKIDDFGEEKFEEFTNEPYGEEKQKREVKNVIIKKALELENTKFSISNNDFEYGDILHIAFLKVITGLEKDGFLISYGITFNFGGIVPGFEGSVEILESIEDLIKRSVKPATKQKEKKIIIQEKKIKELPLQPLPKFHFKEGVLFRDFCDEIIVIKGENSQEYRLLGAAIKLPASERIDTLTDSIEIDEWRKLYDTARRLNEKIKNTFKINNFFDIDYQNKKLRKTVE
jgi:hypothetical protein